MSKPLLNPDPDIMLTTRSHAETVDLGMSFGRLISSATVIGLYGDLGSGKTAFVQGLAQGLDVDPAYYITSPSYTLINEYPGRHPLFHIDLYRIDSFFELEELGLYEIIEGAGVVAIEWADKFPPHVLPTHVVISFMILDDASRKISLNSQCRKGQVTIEGIKEALEST